MHAGPTANSDSAILRFTAASTGSFVITSQFFAGDSGETFAYIVRDGDFASPLFNKISTNPNPTYNTVLSLTSGETIDFVVANNGNFLFGSTPLTVQVSTIPEPASALLLVAGVAGVGLGSARSSRAKQSKHR